MFLHVMSARRELSWNVFRRTFDALTIREALDIAKPSFVRSTLLRRFDSLAHAETISIDGDRRVVVAASALVRLPTEESSAVLVGARSIETIERLRALAPELNVTVTSADQRCEDAALVPSRISIHTSDQSVLAQCATTLGVAYDGTPVAWTLGQLSAGLEDVSTRLQFETSAELNWPLADFDVSRCHFRPRGGMRPASCLTRYRDPVTSAYRYCLWKDDASAWVEADWGRFFALREAQANVMWFDPRANLLAVPETVPLPRLIARALTLCSGYVAHTSGLPHYGTATRASLFTAVPQSLAALIATKLGQPLGYRKLAV